MRKNNKDMDEKMQEKIQSIVEKTVADTMRKITSGEISLDDPEMEKKETPKRKVGRPRKDQSQQITSDKIEKAIKKTTKEKVEKKKPGRPKKTQVTSGQIKLEDTMDTPINDNIISANVKASNVISSMYKLFVDDSKSKFDIMAFLQSQVNGNDELESIFGYISDDMLAEVRKNNEQNFEVLKDDIDDIVINTNHEFEVLDIVKMDKSVKKTFVEIPSMEEARFLEDIYYQTQSKRIIIENQLRSLKQERDNDIKNGKSTNNKMFLEWYLYNTKVMEDQIKKALEIFSDSNYLSKWAKKVIGIGPVFATRLVANLEIKEDEFGNLLTHANSWWSYCGLNDNNRPWLSKEQSKEYVEEAIRENNGVLDDDAVKLLTTKTQWKFSFYDKNCRKENGTWDKSKLIKYSSIIPYNRNLKTLMHLIGQSFTFSKNREGSLYGRLLKERMDLENTKNARGDYADQAEKALREKNYKKDTVAYKYYSQGMLPPKHITARCERYAVKMFISHLYEAAYWNKYGKQAPNPYVLSFIEGHTDYIGPEVPYDSVERDEQ